jgi:hypothetical protein
METPTIMRNGGANQQVSAENGIGVKEIWR